MKEKCKKACSDRLKVTLRKCKFMKDKSKKGLKSIPKQTLDQK